MQRLGVGRTPVREALQRVQREGFVTVPPRRGTCLDDVVHEQRTVLEAICHGDGDTAERVAIAHTATFEPAIRDVI
jgi:DNA-binding GntR family transcriptional regulator